MQVMQSLGRTRLITAICCVGVVATGLSFGDSAFSLALASAFCIAPLLRAVPQSGSRIKMAQLFFLNAGILAIVAGLLRLTVNRVAWRFLPASSRTWIHRIYSACWVSEYAAIILALVAAGLLTVHIAGKIGGDATQQRFQRCTIAGALVLVVVNIVHFFRPVSCADCFFPYGLPFTLFTDGGFAGGGGIVWHGLIGDAALVPLCATICTLLWSSSVSRMKQV